MPSDQFKLAQLLLSPVEELDREFKNWLDITDDASKAKIAKELLALANYGGGYLIFGFDDGTGLESQPRPEDLSAFTVDAVNKIVAKFAEPRFQCHLELIPHPEHQRLFPVVTVPGGHVTPIRCKSSFLNVLEADRYYTRLPGPESSTPRTSKDWDDLIRRCLINSREELLNSIRLIMGGKLPEERQSQSVQEALVQWSGDCDTAWHNRVAKILPNENPSRFSLGTWSIAYKISGLNDSILYDDLVQMMKDSPGGSIFPAWNVAALNTTKSNSDTDDTCEWWNFSEQKWPGAWSYYGRASTDLRFFLRGGNAEDIGLGPGRPEPGTSFYSSNPMTFLLQTMTHAMHVGKMLDKPSLTLSVEIIWTDTRGRNLRAANNSYDSKVFSDLMFYTQTTDRSNISVSIKELDLKALETNFKELVQPSVESVFRAFNFFPGKERISAYIARFKDE